MNHLCSWLFFHLIFRNWRLITSWEFSGDVLRKRKKIILFCLLSVLSLVYFVLVLASYFMWFYLPYLLFVVYLYKLFNVIPSGLLIFFSFLLLPFYSILSASFPSQIGIINNIENLTKQCLIYSLLKESFKSTIQNVYQSKQSEIDESDPDYLGRYNSYHKSSLNGKILIRFFYLLLFRLILLLSSIFERYFP